MIDLSKVYPTVREAAIAGTREAIERSKRDGYEWGGLVGPVENEFKVLGVVTSKSPREVNIFSAIGITDRLMDRATAASVIEKSCGYFHVHPYIRVDEEDLNELNSRYFSFRDHQLGVEFGGLHYLGSAKTGKVYEFDYRSFDQFMTSMTDIIDAISMVPGLALGREDTDELIAIQGTEVYSP